VNNYIVTDTREVSTLTQAGTEKKYYRVWIETLNGATGSIDISVGDWTEDKVPAILEEKAAELDLAFDLTKSV